MMIRICGKGLDPEDMDVKVGSDLIANTDTVSEQIKKGKDLEEEHKLHVTSKHKGSEIICSANSVSFLYAMGSSLQLSVELSLSF